VVSTPSRIAEELLRHRRILIVSHVDPDGDTIGSALGLAWALRSLGREVLMGCDDPVPEEAAALPGADEFSSSPPQDVDAIVAVDASDERRMGSLFRPSAERGGPLIVIDHHITNGGYGDLNLVMDTSATAEIVLLVVDALGVSLDATIARCLLTGVVTDTQGFRTASTTANSLTVAQRLMAAGADLVQISNQAFNRRSLSMLSLWGRALTAAEMRSGVLWAELPLAWLPQGNSDGQVGSGLANLLNTVREARVSALFTEQDDGLIDVSIRAKPGYDVSGVALAFGGGGHAGAAGCQVKGSLAGVREAVVDALTRLVNTQG